VVQRHDDVTVHTDRSSNTLRPTQALPPAKIVDHTSKHTEIVDDVTDEANVNITKERREVSTVIPTGGDGDTKKVSGCLEQSRNKKIEPSDDRVLKHGKIPSQSPITMKKTQSPTCPEDGVEVRLIDFAHFCSRDPVIHPGPDTGFLYGLDKLVELLRAMMQ